MHKPTSHEGITALAEHSQTDLDSDQLPKNRIEPEQQPGRPSYPAQHSSQNLPTRYPWSHQAQIHSVLIFFAIWGLLTRLGLNTIGDFNQPSVFSLLLVQVLGCFFMGASVTLQSRFGKIHPLLYLSITTGYCGSVTTFSSWMLQVFQEFSNTSRYSRGRFSNFLDGLNMTYVTISLSLFALQTGFYCGSQIENSIERKADQRRVKSPVSEDEVSHGKIMTTTIILAGPLTWLGSIFIFIWGPIHWRGPVSYSMIISPAGTILRYYLAKLNLKPVSINNGFPMGTYMANLIATALLALFSILQFSTRARENPEYCASLQGLRDGFCGCLSTISTFFLELHRTGPNFKNFRYALSSWISGQLVCLLIFGVYFWTHDVVHQRCGFPTRKIIS